MDAIAPILTTPNSETGRKLGRDDDGPRASPPCRAVNDPKDGVAVEPLLLAKALDEGHRSRWRPHLAAADEEHEARVLKTSAQRSRAAGSYPVGTSSIER